MTFLALFWPEHKSSQFLNDPVINIALTLLARPTTTFQVSRYLSSFIPIIPPVQLSCDNRWQAAREAIILTAITLFVESQSSIKHQCY